MGYILRCWLIINRGEKISKTNKIRAKRKTIFIMRTDICRTIL